MTYGSISPVPSPWEVFVAAPIANCSACAADTPALPNAIPASRLP
jgi:hypothetical protein